MSRRLSWQRLALGFVVLAVMLVAAGEFAP